MNENYQPKTSNECGMESGSAESLLLSMLELSSDTERILSGISERMGMPAEVVDDNPKPAQTILALIELLASRAVKVNRDLHVIEKELFDMFGPLRLR